MQFYLMYPIKDIIPIKIRLECELLQFAIFNSNNINFDDAIISH